MVLLYTDPALLEHKPARQPESGKPHPESPARYAHIADRLLRSGLADQCRLGLSEMLSVEEINTVHHPSVAKRIERMSSVGNTALDSDTMVSKHSYTVARLAAGMCASAVHQVLTGDEKHAFCFVRPPGHHASRTIPKYPNTVGFCLFNNVALAANRAVEEGADRVLIVDWDVHHGNGTQNIFYEDPRVTVCNIHRYGNGFYPKTGAKTETGTGAGLGYTFNEPLPSGTRRQQYFGAFRAAVDEAAGKSRPDIVLVSAGFDAHAEDPIGTLGDGRGLETADYAAMTQYLLSVADVHSQGRLVSCLEGGYNVHALAESVEAHVRQLVEHENRA